MRGGFRIAPAQRIVALPLQNYCDELALIGEWVFAYVQANPEESELRNDLGFKQALSTRLVIGSCRRFPAWDSRVR